MITGIRLHAARLGRMPSLRCPDRVPGAVGGRRGPGGCAVLLILRGLWACWSTPSGSLGTDTGAKVYTLEVMDRGHTADPNVGYWAEDLDPDGNGFTRCTRHGAQRTSWLDCSDNAADAQEATEAKYAWGGYRAALLLPMLGSVACGVSRLAPSPGRSFETNVAAGGRSG